MKEKDTPASVDFGYRRVSPEEKTRRVGGVFHSVASRYDCMNDLMSAGLHRAWKNLAVARSAVKPGDRVLDIAGGTGDMALRYLPRLGSQGQLVLVDINSSMLTMGRDRLLEKGICAVHFVQANAERLPFPPDSFAHVGIAFGLRNVTHKEDALGEMLRVLKPGGELLILEFSRPRAKALDSLFHAYCFSVLPVLGRVVARDADSYRYLAESIRRHPDRETLRGMMENAGFTGCRYQDLSGGIVALHQGTKA